MPRFRCYNCPDRRPHRYGKYREFEADDPAPACPACGAMEPAVQILTDIHLLIVDPQGPIYGQSGLRYRIACEPRRDILAVPLGEHYAATPEIRAVTCPSCLGTPDAQAMRKAFPHLLMEEALKAGFQIDDKGCCG